MLLAADGAKVAAAPRPILLRPVASTALLEAPVDLVGQVLKGGLRRRPGARGRAVAPAPVPSASAVALDLGAIHAAEIETRVLAAGSRRAAGPDSRPVDALLQLGPWPVRNAAPAAAAGRWAEALVVPAKELLSP